MRYVSLDLETTGLDPQKDLVLQASFVVEDTEAKSLPLTLELPHFTCFIRHDRYEGQAAALAMNAWILKELSEHPDDRQHKDTPIIRAHQFENEVLTFLLKHFNGDQWGKVVLAGKNVAGFDRLFLPYRVDQWFNHRCIDVGSVLIDWNSSGPKSLSTLKKECDLVLPVSHDARKDAMDVIDCLRTTYNRRLCQCPCEE